VVRIKIIKMHVTRRYGQEHYYCLFDEIPEITYEKIGSSYVGSATDNNGNIIFSNYLGYESFGNAFGGRELTLKMKDGTTEKVKDHWFDWGHYKNHGEFIDIGGGTLEKLQECYVYCGYNINKNTFERMLDDYYSREKEYKYDEIEEWCNLQYIWYPVIINNKKIPLMVNKKGDFVERESKKRIYVRENHLRYISGNTHKEFKQCLFKYSYMDGNKKVKIERKMLDVLKDSLTDYTTEQIISNCKLNF
jgi:hypothetical protein